LFSAHPHEKNPKQTKGIDQSESLIKK